MLPFEDRYSRQRRLPEVGQQGQLRLERAKLVVSAGCGESAWLEALYLHRAGVGQLELRAHHSAAQFPHAEVFENPAARSVAIGAHRALQQLCSALNVTEQ